MSVKVVHAYDNDLISRVALNCNDIMFRDFKRDIYGEAIYRMQKKLAAHYDLMNRAVTLSVLDATAPVSISVTDFREESKVTINGVPYYKRDETAEGNAELLTKEDFASKTYKIWYSDTANTNGSPYTWEMLAQFPWDYVVGSSKNLVTQDWLIEYNNMAVGDTIVIDYLSMGEFADQATGSIFIPEKYQEELIRLATVYMGRLGIAKFLGAKQDKYLTIIRTYTHKSAIEEQHLEKDVPWLFIKPLQYP